MSNDSTTFDLIGLPIIGITVSTISMILNGLIVLTFMRYQALRIKDGLYSMMLLSTFDTLNAAIYLITNIYMLLNSIQPFNWNAGQCMPLVSNRSIVLFLLLNPG